MLNVYLIERKENVKYLKTFLVLLILSFTVAACSTNGINRGDTYGAWETGEKQYLEKHTFTDTQAFAPSSTDSFFMICKDEGEARRCKPMGKSKHDSAAGAVSGFGSTVVTSAGIVGGAYFLGKGIGDSGDTFTDNSTVNSDNKVKGKQEQGGQYQGQGQHSNTSTQTSTNQHQGQGQAAIAGSHSSATGGSGGHGGQGGHGGNGGDGFGGSGGRGGNGSLF